MRAGKMEAMQAEVSGLTVDELRKNLVTLDYRGPEFKALCLDRMLAMARAEGSVRPAEDNNRSLDL